MAIFSEDEKVKTVSDFFEFRHLHRQSNTTPRKADKYRTALQEIDARVLEMDIAAELKEVYEE